MQVVAHETTSDLSRVVARVRLQLGLERLTLFALRGAMVGGLSLTVLSVAAWLSGGERLTWPAALPLVAAIAVALARWPSDLQAARAADRRLRLDERLATAVEVARRAGRGRFDHLQLHDALERARAAPGLWSTPDGRLRRETFIAIGVVLAATLSLLLTDLPRPLAPTVVNEGASAADEVAVADSGERLEPAEADELTPAQAQPVEQAPDATLANRVEQEQAERAALDRLSKALSSTSAGQPAAEAIQQGNFAAARDQLASLGEEADQLSDAAKQQLSRALQNAAATTAQTDRQLSERERQVAQALSRPNYNDQRQSLRSLGEQVERSAERSVSSDQLAREAGRLQQQQQQQQAGAGAQPGGGGNRSAPSTPGGQQGGQQQAGAAGGGAMGDDQGGQQGGPGIGAGANSDVLGDQGSRLDTAGDSVQVPAKLGGGPGVRPLQGNEQDTGDDPHSGLQSVSEALRAQQTGQVAPEQNLVPGEQRPVVRGYFR